jgi:hypothetical protein
MTTLKIKLEDFIGSLSNNYDFGGGEYLDQESGEIIINFDNEDELPEDFFDNARYQLIEPLLSSESFQIMQDFVDQLQDNAAAKQLQKALNGKKPFRNFKDAVYEVDVADEWYQFEHERLKASAEDWCKNNGIQVEWV